ncbi:MAG: TonB-dependent receptor [Bacteroidota bacterium]
MKQLILLLLLLSLQNLYAQNTLKGIVTDEKGEALIGVSIALGDGELGTVTDFDGTFSLTNTQPLPWTLLVSYIGFESQTIEVTSTAAELSIQLGNDPYQLNEIVVSANKRLQSVQQIPMSITAISPLTLRRAGHLQFTDFASGIPNLGFSPSGSGNSGRANYGVSIRGIEGTGTTAFYLDETPLPEDISIRMLDVARIEVLKGPQGTLYGARNMGGAVKVVTNQPDTRGLSGSANVSLANVTEGDFDYNARGSLNIPLTDQLALRVAGYYDFESGVYDRVIDRNANVLNLQPVVTTSLSDGTAYDIATQSCPECNLEDVENIDDERNYGFHASLGFFPNERLSIFPKVIVQRQRGDGYDFSEGSPDNFTQIRGAGITESFQDDWEFYALTGKLELENATIVSATSYLNRSVVEREDASEWNSAVLLGYSPNDDSANDFWASQIAIDRGITQFTQELRYQSNWEGRFNFTAGLFYTEETRTAFWLDDNTGINEYLAINVFEDEASLSFIADKSVPFYRFNGNYSSREFALFGEAYVELTPRLKATLGLRYFDAQNGIDNLEDGYFTGDPNIVQGQQPETGFNPKLSLTYQINKDQMLYGVVARGFRLGGANDVVSLLFCADELPQDEAGNPTFPRFFESDFLWNYELGFKGKWADGKLLTNAAVFYNDWQNLQLGRPLECGYSYIDNVGEARTLGAELEVKAKLNAQLEIGGGLGLLDATITDGGAFDEVVEAGDRIVFTPNRTANLNLQYSIPLKADALLYFWSNLQYVSERLNTFSPEDPAEAFLIFAPYTLINARIGLEFSNYRFSIFGRNLTNAIANFGTPRAFNGEVPGRPRYSISRPLTIGVQVGAYF